MVEDFSSSMSQAGVLAVQTIVSTQQEDEPPGSDEVRRLMQGPDLRVIAGWLRATYPDAASHVEDAVVEGVVRFLAKRAAGVGIENPGGWIRVAAQNYVRNKLQREISRETADDALSVRFVESGDSFIEDKDVFRYLKDLVERWESRRLRVITLLFLEAGYEGEPLSHVEAAELASDILGEPVPWTSIGQTRKRGLTRLRDEILRIAEESGINPVTGRETV